MTACYYYYYIVSVIVTELKRTLESLKNNWKHSEVCRILEINYNYKKRQSKYFGYFCHAVFGLDSLVDSSWGHRKVLIIQHQEKMLDHQHRTGNEVTIDYLRTWSGPQQVNIFADSAHMRLTVSPTLLASWTLLLGVLRLHPSMSLVRSQLTQYALSILQGSNRYSPPLMICGQPSYRCKTIITTKRKWCLFTPLNHLRI